MSSTHYTIWKTSHIIRRPNYVRMTNHTVNMNSKNTHEMDTNPKYNRKKVSLDHKSGAMARIYDSVILLKLSIISIITTDLLNQLF